MNPDQNGFVIRMAGAYLFFSLVPVLGRFSKAIFGEFSDMLMMIGYAWPYPLVLAVHHWFPNPGIIFLLVTMILGFALVALFALYLHKRFLALLQFKWQTTACSLILWYVPLFFVQLLAVGLAWALGYPVGE